jgi:hypothetical protein
MSCLTLLLGKLAIAQNRPSTSPADERPFSVEVERDDVAVSCPDRPWFSARIASHAGNAGHAGIFKLTLSKRRDAWYARIQRWEQNRSSPAAERVLRDRSQGCEPLAEAAALTIAMSAENLAKRAEPSPPNPAAAIEEQAVPVTPASARPQPETDRSKVWVGAGGGAAASWISPIAPELGFAVALDSPGLRSGLRLMMTTEQKLAVEPGHVVVQAWLGSVFSCLRLAQGRFGSALCLVGDVAMLRASADGFDDGRPGTRAYGAAGLEAQPSWNVSDGYRISMALGALLPFGRESFSVEGRGVAYVPPELNWRLLVLSEIGAF